MADKGKKNRKLGRNAKACARYMASNTRETNKAKRLDKHLARFPGDKTAAKVFNTLILKRR